jgi:hypothetical protein
MLKKILVSLCLCASVVHSPAQFATPINTTTATTSSYSIFYAAATVTNSFTNQPLWVLNTNYVSVGDSPTVVAGKLNGGLTNAWLWAVAQSNLTLHLSSNFAIASNGLGAVTNILYPLSGNFAIASNRLGAVTNILYPLSTAWSAFQATNVPGVGVGAQMNFDSGNISSSGTGFQTNAGGYFLSDGAGFFNESGAPTFGFPLVGGGSSYFSFIPDGSVYVNAGGANGIDFTSSTVVQLLAASTMYLTWAGGEDIYGDNSGICNIEANGTTFDFESAYTDGSGDFYAPSFNVTSDRGLKEQIAGFSPGTALQMALSLTNYSWRFKARTNTVLRVTHGARGQTTTNLAVRTIAAGRPEVGPMAQDWRLVTGLGNGTNISATSEAGLLLGAVQGLAALQGTLTNAAGARFLVLVNAQTNGFAFVPQ